MNQQHPIVSYLSSSLLGRKPFPPDHLDNRIPLSQSDLTEPIQSFWTYRRYFQTIHKVLAKDSYRVLLDAVRKKLPRSPFPIEMQSVLIYSEKHGNWYHPAKIEVLTPQGTGRFVLNAALTERGQAVMSREIRALEYIEVNFSYPWVPTVYYYQGPVPISPGGSENQERSLSLFLADWFEEFNEFHLSLDPLDGKMKLVLWDGRPKPTYLTNLQARQVYQQISKALTLYYNPRTYGQIFPWHHGAGDFVVQLKGDRPEVRLVTVRNYGPLADPEAMEATEALLFFFLNLSIRMRLDRIDGIGEVAWAGEDCLNATWEGFLEGIGNKEQEGTLAPGFRNKFLKYLCSFSAEDLTEKFSDLLGSYSPEAPDLSVIENNIISHIQQVHKHIKFWEDKSL